MTPEVRSDPKKKFDAIVNGLIMEFKNMHGTSARTLKDHFLDSREQAPNVFINLKNSPLTRREIINTLYAARNSLEYGKKNTHKGGQIILKIRGQESLIYLNVDDLKTKKHQAHKSPGYAGGGERCHSSLAILNVLDL